MRFAAGERGGPQAMEHVVAMREQEAVPQHRRFRRRVDVRHVNKRAFEASRGRALSLR